MRYVIRTLVWGAVAVLIQWLLLGRLLVFQTYPDLTLLFVARIALRYGRLGGSVAGFLTGFALDVLYGTWGIQVFAKTLVGFLIGLLAATERESLFNLPHRAFFAAFLVALLQNGILVLLLALDSGARTLNLITVLWLGCSAYTGFLGMLLSLFGGRISRSG